jgi:hypothetical protein
MATSYELTTFRIAKEAGTERTGGGNWASRCFHCGGTAVGGKWPHTPARTARWCTGVSTRASGRIQQLFSAGRILTQGAQRARGISRERWVRSRGSRARIPRLAFCSSALNSQLLNMFMRLVSSKLQPNGRAAESKRYFRPPSEWKTRDCDRLGCSRLAIGVKERERSFPGATVFPDLVGNANHH